MPSPNAVPAFEPLKRSFAPVERIERMAGGGAPCSKMLSLASAHKRAGSYPEAREVFT